MPSSDSRSSWLDNTAWKCALTGCHFTRLSAALMKYWNLGCDKSNVSRHVDKAAGALRRRARDGPA